MARNSKSLRERFTVALVHLSRRWRWHLDRRLQHTGLTQARWTTLLQIDRGGDGMTQRALAEHMGIEAATLVPLLDSLVERELVVRRVGEVDRRQKTVHLTAAAVPVLEQIETIADELRAELTRGVSAADLEACVRVFEHIQERMPAGDKKSASGE
jgi:MarR family transcriptional regulator, transcriptional regulator for hemolysin